MNFLIHGKYLTIKTNYNIKFKKHFKILKAFQNYFTKL
jgi:hypothetical protein